MNQKPIQTLQELSQNLRADCYYFVSPCSAGDTYYLCALKQTLEKQLQGKIIFVIKPSHKAVVEIFAYEDYIICENSVTTNFHKTPQCFEIDSVVSTPTLGKLYPAHPIPLRKWNYPWKTMLEMYLHCFDLPLDTKGDLPTNLPKIDESLRAKLHKIAPLDKIILFCPEANSCECLPTIIFKDECDRLLKQGYKIIVNIPNHKEYLRFFSDGMYDLDLSLKEAVALGISCAGVISTRSGFCDIIAPHCENLIVYDTNCAWSSIKYLNKATPPQEISVYDNLAYKRYLRAKRTICEFLPMKLYKRYATKGFLKKLRTPFTLYFKIYRRDKNVALADFGGKEMREFIQKELSQTYEYQLGLALQKACERFWCGGFLLFPFDYLKIRKEKGKKFIRIGEIL